MERDPDAWVASLKPINITDFFRSLPRRVPPETATDERAAARERIAFYAAELNAIMLGRALDQRVPRDVEALSETIADRSARYTSDDWATAHEGRSKLDHARGAVAAISAELRGVAPDDGDEDSWDAPGDADDAGSGD